MTLGSMHSRLRTVRTLILAAGLIAGEWVVAFPQDSLTLSVDTSQQLAPKVFLDCPPCDQDFIKAEVTFVNFVRDPKLADVHILVSRQATAGGGREFTLEFIGRERFAGMTDTLVVTSLPSDTEDALRRLLLRVVQLGLMRFVARTPEADLIQPWGSVNAGVSRSNYFHDASRYRLVLSSRVSLRLVEELSLEVGGTYLRSHDQLSLVKGTASEQDVLVHRRELETSYTCWADVTIRYTFGSIYSTVVNRRFGY